MAVQHRRQPSRLNIPSSLDPSNLGYAHPHAPYTPPLHTALQSGFNSGPPIIPAPYARGFLSPHPVAQPFRPQHRMNGSLAMTPTPNSLPQPSSAFSQRHTSISPGAPSYIKSRRTASISIGGPPKAVIGGPQRKHSPLPGASSAQDEMPSIPEPLKKKINIKLPEEGGPTIYEGRPYHVAPWTRLPLGDTVISLQQFAELDGPEHSSSMIYEISESEIVVREGYEVFLPPPDAWMIWRKSVVEEGLSRLGLDSDDAYGQDGESDGYFEGEQYDVVSSPADPALLSFKLNKLQRLQSNTLATLPTSEDSQVAASVIPTLWNTFSSAPSFVTPISELAGRTLSPSAGDTSISPYPESLALSSNCPGPSRPLSRGDFARGFGLDIPEEREEEEAIARTSPFGFIGDQRGIRLESPNRVKLGIEEDDFEGHMASTVAPTRYHSRHTSRLSARHSLDDNRHPDGPQPDELTQFADELSPFAQNDALLSQDLAPASSHENESEGEFSNPSDEEKVRQRRIHLRMSRLSRGTEEIPRQIPGVASPSNEAPLRAADELPNRSRQDEVSNPSDEERHTMHAGQGGVEILYPRPLPPIPHSRDPSTSGFVPKEDVNVHSRSPSGQSRPLPIPGIHNRGRFPATRSLSREQLNPLAKPFTFGAGSSANQRLPLSDASSRIPSGFGKHTLSASAQEFQPISFRSTASAFHPGVNREPPEMELLGMIEGDDSDGGSRDASLKSNLYGSEKALEFSAGVPNNKPYPGFSKPSSDETPIEPPKVFTESADFSSVKDSSLADIYPQKIPNMVPSALARTAKKPSGRHQNGARLDMFKDIESVETIGQSRSESDLARLVVTQSRRQSLDDFNVASISHNHLRSEYCSSVHTSPNTISLPSVLANVPTDNLATAKTVSPTLMETIINGPLTQRDTLEEILSTGIKQLRNDCLSVVSDIRATLEDITSRNFTESITSAIGSEARHLVNGNEIATASQPHGWLEVNSDIITDAVNRSIVPVTLSAAEIASRLDGLEKSIRVRTSEERELLVHDVLAVLTPRLDDIRADSLDWDLLTARLASAVRPQIHELIDLASDKKETASLIVQLLDPWLRGAMGDQYERLVNILDLKAVGEITRVLHDDFKENVSDLVVERLDARLKLRQQVLNPDILSATIKNAVGASTQSLSQSAGQTYDLIEGVKARVESLFSDIAAISTSQENLSKQSTAHLLQEVREHDIHHIGTIKHQHAEILSAMEHLMIPIKEVTLAGSATSNQIYDVLKSSAENSAIVATVPESLSTIADGLKNLRADVSGIQEVVNQSKLLTESQADSATLTHKLMMVVSQLEERMETESVTTLEADSLRQERNLLTERVHDVTAQLTLQEVRLQEAAMRSDRAEASLEESRRQIQSLKEDLQDSKLQAHELGKSNEQLALENRRLEKQVASIELQLEHAKERTSSEELRSRRQREETTRILEDQSHRDQLAKATERLDILLEISRAQQSKEKDDLQAIRDRSKVLEGEHVALQKRFREQESKLSNIERASATARQNLMQSQQRAAEWERKAKDLEASLERAQSQSLALEESKTKLEVSVEALREKQESHTVLSDSLRLEVDMLQQHLQKVTGELEEARNTSVYSWRGYGLNGTLSSTPGPERHKQERASTPTLIKPAVQLPKHSLATPESDSDAPMTSTWDSMHAPKHLKAAPGSHNILRSHSFGINRASAPSPSPSVVSNAPTLQEDGWWS